MTDQTIVVQTAPQEQPAPAKAKQPRQMVRFTFYKLDPQWQLLPLEQRQAGKQQLLQIIEEHSQRVLLRTYSLFGLRADSDFLIWQAAYSEYWVTPVFWPDFDAGQLQQAIQAYGQRERRFGGLSEE